MAKLDYTDVSIPALKAHLKGTLKELNRAALGTDFGAKAAQVAQAYALSIIALSDDEGASEEVATNPTESTHKI